MTRTEVERLQSQLEVRTQIVKEGQERINRLIGAVNQLLQLMASTVNLLRIVAPSDSINAIERDAVAIATKGKMCVYKNHAGVFEYGCDQCDPEQEDWRDDE